MSAQAAFINSRNTLDPGALKVHPKLVRGIRTGTSSRRRLAWRHVERLPLLPYLACQTVFATSALVAPKGEEFAPVLLRS